MNSVIALLISTTILVTTLFILLVLAMTSKSRRARVKSDIKRIKSQVSRDMPEAEW